MIARCSLAIALVIGCGTRTAPPPVKGPADSSQSGNTNNSPVEAPKAELVSACPAPAVDASAAQTAFLEATALDARVKAGELDRKTSWTQRYKLYNRAAEGGHREAQARAGAMKFANMFTVQAPAPTERFEYVEALTRLVVAARRGSTDAAKFMPGMEALMFGQVPEIAEPPLSELPKEWVEESIKSADKWIKCHAGDTGEAANTPASDTAPAAPAAPVAPGDPATEMK